MYLILIKKIIWQITRIWIFFLSLENFSVKCIALYVMQLERKQNLLWHHLVKITITDTKKKSMRLNLRPCLFPSPKVIGNMRNDCEELNFLEVWSRKFFICIFYA